MDTFFFFFVISVLPLGDCGRAPNRRVAGVVRRPDDENLCGRGGTLRCRDRVQRTLLYAQHARHSGHGQVCRRRHPQPRLQGARTVPGRGRTRRRCRSVRHRHLLGRGRGREPSERESLGKTLRIIFSIGVGCRYILVIITRSCWTRRFQATWYTNQTSSAFQKSRFTLKTKPFTHWTQSFIVQVYRLWRLYRQVLRWLVRKTGQMRCF